MVSDHVHRAISRRAGRMGICMSGGKWGSHLKPVADDEPKILFFLYWPSLQECQTASADEQAKEQEHLIDMRYGGCSQTIINTRYQQRRYRWCVSLKKPESSSCRESTETKRLVWAAKYEEVGITIKNNDAFVGWGWGERDVKIFAASSQAAKRFLSAASPQTSCVIQRVTIASSLCRAGKYGLRQRAEGENVLYKPGKVERRYEIFATWSRDEKTKM